MPVTASIPHDSPANTSPFEGPEKLLEIWFAPSPDQLSARDSPNAKQGLRAVDRAVWEEMLDIVKCKVLNAVHGVEVDAYLLSESSLFVFAHKLILKTCGTTLNLLGLPRILEIAASHCGLTVVHRFFYSRKSFMFPERQQGPHKEWRAEVEFLDHIFGAQKGAAYTVGKVNGDHWLLYLTNPVTDNDDVRPGTPLEFPFTEQDYTLEILMTKLSPNARDAFLFPNSEPGPQDQAAACSRALGIDALFPAKMTTLDAFAFTPCGYSANALLQPDGAAEGYYTIHVTPEDGWSYASFECNVPLSHYATGKDAVLPDLQTLIQRVVQIFQPENLSLTLFTNSADEVPFNNGHAVGIEHPSDSGHAVGNGHANGNGHVKCLAPEAAVDSAQRAFRAALLPKGYKRTDKINYEFGGYDLAFASFEAR